MNAYPVRKYIWWNSQSFLVFDTLQIHSDVAKAHSDQKPTDAGFLVELPNGTVRIFGESTSLGLKCDKSHEAEIAASLRGRKVAA